MCGIAGVVQRQPMKQDQTLVVNAMRDRLRHRGPDDQGVFLDQSGLAALAHARLSILDLTPNGHQPMFSADERYVIVFNGEIYNFSALRREIEAKGHVFRSLSDTEVILHLYQQYGSHCVSKMEGMFAFAVWDTVERKCFLARDPLGIKPLYLWQNEGRLAFASEVRALLEANLGPRCLDPIALQGYFLFGSVQEPQTLVEGITTLPAGHWLEWRDGRCRTEQFWTMKLCPAQAMRDGAAPSSSHHRHDAEHDRVSRKEAIGTARCALLETVQKHYVSDVPVSLFLSGGIDSTALLGLSNACGFERLRTFSISFHEAEFNEGDLARQTARHFQTDHHDWKMEDSDGLRLIGDFLNAMDQPSNDGFNTFCVSKFAHDHGAKVVLSGLGGDELFGGYPSFNRIPKLLKLHHYASFAGRSARHGAASIVDALPSPRAKRIASFLRGDGSVDAAYWTMRGFFLPRETEHLLRHYTGQSSPNSDLPPSFLPRDLDPKDAVSFLETTQYMRNQLLRDSDVMSMAWGLELRVPLVDSHLLDSLAHIPSKYRLAAGKQLLLDAVPEIPEWIRSQPKRGFRFPFERWIDQSWASVFEQLEKSIPVKLGAWYRRWSLYTLEHFLRVNRIDAPGLRK